jgi:adenosylmethionine-8-amino-7-oxononanoate aminotransferase
MPTADKILYYAFNRKNPTVARADRYYYYDADQKQYLDSISGMYNCVLGHTMPDRIARIFERRNDTLTFASMAFFENEGANRLADRLLSLMPDYAATGFYQSGADAVEAALRCALQVSWSRHSKERSKIVGRRGTYHGLTLGGLALGASDSIRQQDVPNFLHAEPQDCFNCPFGLTYPSCELKCAASLEDLIKKEGPETIAAFVGVPSTSGGPVPDEYWPKIRSICDDYGILLVSDEVLEGMWRTGPTIALKRWNVTPDIVATGKPLGAGFMPIFAMLVTDDVRQSLADNGKFWGGHTYSGHVLSCEVALGVLDEIEDGKLSSIGIATVNRGLEMVASKVAERIKGARWGMLGAMGRIRIPCSVPRDQDRFYLDVQILLRQAGLIAWIEGVGERHLELGFAPPFNADDEFFHELEVRLNLFMDKLTGAIGPLGL